MRSLTIMALTILITSFTGYSMAVSAQDVTTDQVMKPNRNATDASPAMSYDDNNAKEKNGNDTDNADFDNGDADDMADNATGDDDF